MASKVTCRLPFYKPRLNVGKKNAETFSQNVKSDDFSIIISPDKGIENIRKPIVHELYRKNNEFQETLRDENNALENKEDISNNKEEIIKNKEDTNKNKDKILIKKEDMPKFKVDEPKNELFQKKKANILKNEEIIQKNKEDLSINEEIEPIKNEDIPKIKIDILQNEEILLKKNESILKNEEIIPTKKEDIPAITDESLSVPESKDFNLLSKIPPDNFNIMPNNIITIFNEYDIVSFSAEKKINQQEKQHENAKSFEKVINKDEKTINKVEKIGKNYKIKDKTQINRTESLIIKVQAHVRGFLARERYKILHKKSKILYRRAKRIQNSLLFIAVISKDDKIFATINDGASNQTIQINENLSPIEIFERIDKNDKGYYLRNLEKSLKREEEENHSIKNEENIKKIPFQQLEKNEEHELIKSIKLKINKEECEVKYLLDHYTNALLIQAKKYSNSKIYSTEEKNLSFTSKPLLINYINNEIEPYLTIIDQELIIYKEEQILEKEFLAKGTRIMQKKEFAITVSKVINKGSISIEFIAECSFLATSLTKVFLPNAVLDCLSSFNIVNLENDPHLALLTLSYTKDDLVLKKVNKPNIECLISEKSVLNNSEYLIKIFRIQEDIITYFFEAFNINSPPVSSFSITDENLSDVYKMQPIQINRNILSIFKSINIKNGKLLLIPTSLKKETKKPNQMVSLLKLQSLIRGYLLRDRNKLKQSQKNLLYSTIKKFENFSITINAFKIEETLLLEILSELSQKAFYLFITRPNAYFAHFSRFFDIKCIAGSVICVTGNFFVPSVKGNLPFIPSTYFSPEEIRLSSDNFFPMFRKKINTDEYIIFARELSNKDLLVKVVPSKQAESPHRIFSVKEITEIIGIHKPLILLNQIKYQNGSIVISDALESSVQISNKKGEHIIYRTCKHISEKLYQVILSISDTDHGKELTFNLKQGSLHSLRKLFKIDLKTACEKTGFTEEYIIPMADYMVKHMFIVKHSRVILDDSKPPYDFNKAKAKILSVLKGYITRTKIKAILDMHCKAKFPFKISGENLTALIFKKNNDFILYIVKKFEVLSIILDKKIIQEQLHHLEKFLQTHILPKLKFK